MKTFDKNLPFIFDICSVVSKQVGDFFKFLWPFQFASSIIECTYQGRRAHVLTFPGEDRVCPRSASNTPWSLNQSCVARRHQFSCSFRSDVRFLGPPLKKNNTSIKKQKLFNLELKKCRYLSMPKTCESQFRQIGFD